MELIFLETKLVHFHFNNIIFTFSFNINNSRQQQADLWLTEATVCHFQG